MKQSQFYYLLRRGLLKSMSVVKEGLVMFNKFTTAGISHPAQGSAEFDGASDYISIPDLGIEGTQARTIMAWTYDNDISADKVIVGLGDSNTTGQKYSFKLNGGSPSGLRIEVKGAGYNSTTLSRTQNKWHHVAITQSGANLNTGILYLDGSAEAVTLNYTSDTQEIGENVIGAQPITFSEPMNGNLANVAIWNRALSSDEINSVMWKGYQSLTSKEKTGLQAWYSLDDIDGTIVPDSSGNGNNGTAY